MEAAGLTYICTLFLYFCIYSFIGWVWESIYCSIVEGHPINRGFLNGPLCPIYGFGAIADLAVMGDISYPMAIFFSCMVIASILEYFVSWLLEKLFDMQWWDYSHMRFNLNGRICLAGAFAFGLFGTLLVLFIHPAIAGLVARIPELWVQVGAGVIFVLIAVDTVLTTNSLLKLRKRLQEAQAALKKNAEELQARMEELQQQMQERAEETREQLQERAEGTREQIQERTESLQLRIEELRVKAEERIMSGLDSASALEIRIIKSFPTLKTRDQSGLIEKLRERRKSKS